MYPTCEFEVDYPQQGEPFRELCELAPAFIWTSRSAEQEVCQHHHKLLVHTGAEGFVKALPFCSERHNRERPSWLAIDDKPLCRQHAIAAGFTLPQWDSLNLIDALRSLHGSSFDELEMAGFIQAGFLVVRDKLTNDEQDDLFGWGGTRQNVLGSRDRIGDPPLRFNAQSTREYLLRVAGLSPSARSPLWTIATRLGLYMLRAESRKMGAELLGQSTYMQLRTGLAGSDELNVTLSNLLRATVRRTR